MQPPRRHRPLPSRRVARRAKARAGIAVTLVLTAGACRSTTDAPVAKAIAPIDSTTATTWVPTAAQLAQMRTVRPTVPPAHQSYFGVQLDWVADTPASYDSRLGRVPYDFGRFTSVPMPAGELSSLNSEVAELAPLHAQLFLTVEMPQGISAVTPDVASAFALNLARWNLEGVGVFVRFGQEMNGSWYPWGQNPTAYVAAFRMVAADVHRVALGSVMVWSPNYGGGYPFPGETYEAQPGSAAFKVLDTNHDGRLTEQDDPYAPYYPGDDAVDWVGLTLYHFGDKWPWGANQIPEADKFVDQMTGRYNGDNGNDTSVPNFYQVWSVGHHKPMAISETAALYNDAQAGTGDPEVALKTNWIDQVFNPSVRADFPGLAMINWFEHQKPENGVQGTVDWRATVQPQVRAALQAALASGYLFAPAS